MLQGRSASLQRLLRSLADLVLDKYAGGRAQPGLQPRSRLAASALLECALAELEYGAVRPAEELLTRANQAAGISISLTGAHPLSSTQVHCSLHCSSIMHGARFEAFSVIGCLEASTKGLKISISLIQILI